MPSSMSMPTIAPPKSTNEPKPLPVFSSPTIAPSMSFPSQLHQRQQKQIQPNVSFNNPVATNLTSNLMNGTSQPSLSNPNKMAMGQMMKNTQNTFTSFPAQPSFGGNLMGMNSSSFGMSSNATTGNNKNNGTSNNKSVSLSAQEIKDFLS